MKFVVLFVFISHCKSTHLHSNQVSNSTIVINNLEVPNLDIDRLKCSYLERCLRLFVTVFLNYEQYRKLIVSEFFNLNPISTNREKLTEESVNLISRSVAKTIHPRYYLRLPGIKNPYKILINDWSFDSNQASYIVQNITHIIMKLNQWKLNNVDNICTENNFDKLKVNATIELIYPWFLYSIY